MAACSRVFEPPRQRWQARLHGLHSRQAWWRAAVAPDGQPAGRLEQDGLAHRGLRWDVRQRHVAPAVSALARSRAVVLASLARAKDPANLPLLQTVPALMATFSTLWWTPIMETSAGSAAAHPCRTWLTSVHAWAMIATASTRRGT